MAFKKLPAGSQRTLIYKVRLKPSFKADVKAKLSWLKSIPGHESDTVSDLIRIALVKYITDPEDPRKP